MFSRLRSLPIILIIFKEKNSRFGFQKFHIVGMHEYRFFEFETEHDSFLLESVEFLDEMKTPEIKKT